MNYGPYVPQQYTRIVYDSTSGTGALHFPYLHTLVMFHLSSDIYSAILEGCIGLLENSVFQRGGWRGTRLGSSAGTRHCVYQALHSDILPDTPNLCPSRTDISALYKQFFQRARARSPTRIECLPVILYLDVSRLCRVSQFNVVHEYGGVDACKSYEE
jgi:hypothetical protein